MLRRTASAVFLLTSVLIGIGSLGHAHQWWLHAPALQSLSRDVVQLLKLVWLWVSGTMALFGILLVWTWTRLRQGDRTGNLLPLLISVFYLVEGVWGVLYVGAFFSLFIVLGLTLSVSTWVLGRHAGPARTGA